MTSNLPYLLRAMYEWIIDNGMTPLLVVDVTIKDTRVPRNYIENDRIVLNIHPSAVRELDLANQSLSFSTRFGGAPFQVFIPIDAVMAVYAKENGQGLVFNEKPGKNTDDPDRNNDKPSAKRPLSHLTIVK